ncbi:MAG: KEOPS complex subunit Pcc1 [Promethearchaeota archaeon]|jgi:tRNA threonylcarbamoyladenosine modification (KEOPS) complex  Pcc1 subunit
MNQKNSFSINTVVELLFNDSQIRDISYNSFIPEIQKLQTKRSSIVIEKKNKNMLLFKIESRDITAFRASMNEIISFGKIIDNTIKLANIS